MTTPITTSTTDGQMHNNIMAAGSRDHPPMLAPGRYAQWQSRFLRYIDTRPNGDALRKCILQGPYTPSTGESFNIQDVKNNLFWEFRKFTSGDGETMESYFSRFYKMMNEINRNNLIMAMMQVNVQFLQQLQPEWSRFVTIVKQQHDLDTVSYHKLFDVLKQYQKEVNEIHAERIAKNANPLALVTAAQLHPDPYYQAQKSHQPYAPTSKQSSSTRSNASTKFKGKEIAKPITPLSEKPKRVKDSTHHKEKMLLCKQADKGVPLQAEQSDWLANTDEEIDEQKLEAHYSFMAKIQRLRN
ncbi:hypothetical protein Tco_0977758 [Tanacetum coccineum]|uniref:Gag-Pol polyprotein n=1 Tax=Tanacetum coccineum TaxID=301880 RepID=A0ABQ5EL10_9ASTR